MRIQLHPSCRPAHAPETVSAQQHVTVGATLCRLCVWSPAQWDACPPADRPASAAFFPGLGWVVALPEIDLN